MEKSIKNKKCKKKLKKVLTKLFEDGIVILVLKKRSKIKKVAPTQSLKMNFEN